MKKLILATCILAFLNSCENKETKTSEEVKEQDSLQQANIKLGVEERSQQLQEQGYETFHYQEGDTTYLMQKYFMVFLKSGKNRSQDSIEAANLQRKHLAHLERMVQEGYTSLTGPFGDDGEIRGIVVYNTPTLKMADSLANLDPMVKAGRLAVEVHPWWTSKGGKLK
tara:strand:- start:147 stop:650 length:504 start_codon:yes stop_codon:yes gene_type:complete